MDEWKKYPTDTSGYFDVYSPFTSRYLRVWYTYSRIPHSDPMLFITWINHIRPGAKGDDVLIDMLPQEVTSIECIAKRVIAAKYRRLESNA